MYFVINCIDKPGKLELRQKTRPDHINYLNKYENKFGEIKVTKGKGPAANFNLPDDVLPN